LLVNPGQHSTEERHEGEKKSWHDFHFRYLSY